MRDKELYQKLINASEILHNKALKSSGNFIIVNEQVANIINGTYERIELQKTRKNKLNQLKKKLGL